MDSILNRDSNGRKRNESPRPEPAAAGNSVIPAVLLGFALVAIAVLTYFLVDVTQRFDQAEQDFNDQIAELQSNFPVFTKQVADQGQMIGALTSDLETVRTRMGATEGEIAQARSQAEQIRLEQNRSAETLMKQIVAKADSTQVRDLESRADNRFQAVDQDITDVRQEVSESRTDLEKAWRELAQLGVQVTEQGQLIATNSDGIHELEQRGERDYFEFTGPKKEMVEVAGIRLELRDTDLGDPDADFRLYFDDHRIVRKDVTLNTPLTFYVGKDRTPYELVINEIHDKSIAGYISVPKGAVTEGARLARMN